MQHGCGYIDFIVWSDDKDLMHKHLVFIGNCRQCSDNYKSKTDCKKCWRYPNCSIPDVYIDTIHQYKKFMLNVT